MIVRKDEIIIIIIKHFKWWKHQKFSPETSKAKKGNCNSLSVNLGTKKMERKDFRVQRAISKIQLKG